jgi:hypothetical protein
MLLGGERTASELEGRGRILFSSQKFPTSFPQLTITFGHGIRNGK